MDQPGFGISLDPGNVVYYTHRHVDGEEPVRNHSLLSAAEVWSESACVQLRGCAQMGGEDPVDGLKELAPFVTTVVMKDCALTEAEAIDEYGASLMCAHSREPGLHNLSPRGLGGVGSGGVDVLIVPGTGTVDFDTVMRRLYEGGFDGPLLLEKVPGKTLPEIDANFAA